jgi:hypothetical protein
MEFEARKQKQHLQQQTCVLRHWFRTAGLLPAIHARLTDCKRHVDSQSPAKDFPCYKKNNQSFVCDSTKSNH